MEKQKHSALRRMPRIIAAVVFIVCGALWGILLAGEIGYQNRIKETEAVLPVGSTLLPAIDPETGWWTFTTDREFTILQLTDTHITAGGLAVGNDKKSLSALRTLVERVKPDLLVLTGDMTYDMPVQSGNFNNKKAANLLTSLLEQLAVPYAVTLGNHDSGTFARYSRAEIAAFYESRPHCVFLTGDENVDGYGNYVVNVKNSAGNITQSLFFMDSHSYLKGSFSMKYENIKPSQVEWYKQEVGRLSALNQSLIPSLLFLHIPLNEYEDAWQIYKKNQYRDNDTVRLIYGTSEEKDEHVLCGAGEDDLFETVSALGSTKGIFCGHDHLNYYSLEYKGIRLTYGMSLAYTAFVPVKNKTNQRGGTVITLTQEGAFTCRQERLV